MNLGIFLSHLYTNQLHPRSSSEHYFLRSGAIFVVARSGRLAAPYIKTGHAVALAKADECGLLLNPAESTSPENNRQREQDDCDRHERRAGDVSEQDEEDRDDGEDCCEVVVHSFPIVYRVRLSGARFLNRIEMVFCHGIAG